MNADFHSRVHLGGTYYSYNFKPDTPIKYDAGQFIELYVPHKNNDSRGEKRWFTLSSHPREEFLTITTDLAVEGSSFKKALTMLMPGDRVHISQAMGDFVLPLQQSIPLIFVCIGVGITPARSMISWLKDVHQKRAIHMLYGVSNQSDILFPELIDTPDITLDIFTHKRPLDATVITQVAKNYQKPYIYVSGNEQFVEQITKDLQTTKPLGATILSDYFHGYQGL